MTFESEGLLIVAIYTWLPPASYVVFSDNSGFSLLTKFALQSNLVKHIYLSGLLFAGKQAGFCMMCELQRHIKRCYENSGNAIKPQAILQKLRSE